MNTGDLHAQLDLELDCPLSPTQMAQLLEAQSHLRAVRRQYDKDRTYLARPEMSDDEIREPNHFRSPDNDDELYGNYCLGHDRHLR